MSTTLNAAWYHRVGVMNLEAVHALAVPQEKGKKMGTYISTFSCVDNVVSPLEYTGLKPFKIWMFLLAFSETLKRQSFLNVLGFLPLILISGVTFVNYCGFDVNSVVKASRA
jgi:hypothetical protein